MKEHKRKVAEEKTFGEKGEINPVICVSSVQVTVCHGKLELELCLEQDDNEYVRDLAFGKLASSNATCMTVCSEKGGNCSVCEAEFKERMTTINFTVTALRSVCSCVLSELEFPGVQDDFSQGTIDLEGHFSKCAKIRKMGKQGQMSILPEVNKSSSSRNDNQAKQDMEVNESMSKCEETEKNFETICQPITNNGLEDLHSKSTSHVELVSVPCFQNHMETNNSYLEKRDCEKCVNEIHCMCRNHQLETCTESDKSLNNCALEDNVDINKCKICDVHFKDESELQTHLHLKHSGELISKCPLCDMSFSDQKSLKVHCQDQSDAQGLPGTSTVSSVQGTVNKSKNQCEHCKKTFDLDTELEYHKCHEKSHKPYSCSHCEKTFRMKDYLRKHETVHSEVKKFRCDHCSKSFRRSGDLQSHLTLHTGDKKFKCEQCGKFFTTNAALKRHHLLHAKEKLFQCDVCGKEYASEHQLKNHSKLHNMDTPFTCEHCGKQFTTKHYLQSHMKTHLKCEQVKCHLCGKSYRDPAYLKVHLKSHTGEGLVKCDLCGDNFADPKYLTLHKKKFCKANAVRCDKCDRTFANKLDLSYHVGVHTGERPFECDICGKGFTKSDRLSSHRKRHLDSEKTHECKTCLKRFVCASDLKKHQKSHSAKKKLSLPEKLKYGLEDVDHVDISKETELEATETKSLSLVQSLQPVVSVENVPTGVTNKEHIQTFVGAKIQPGVLRKSNAASVNLQVEFLQTPLASTTKTDRETVTDNLPASLPEEANNLIVLPENGSHKPKSVIQTIVTNSITRLPNDSNNATRLLNNDTQVRDNVTQFTDNVTHLTDVIKNVIHLPHNVILIPDNVHLPNTTSLLRIPDKVTKLSDNITQIPDNVTQLPDNEARFPDNDTQLPDDTQLADSDTQLPDNDTQLTDNVKLIKEKIPENISFIQSLPEITNSVSLIQGQVSNTVTILQASGSKIPDNLTLIQANVSKYDMPNTVTFVPGVSLIQPKVPRMPSGETIMPEDVAMIQEEMSIIEENVPLDMSNEGMGALQLPEANALEDSLSTSINTTEASLVECQHLELPEISLPEDTQPDPYGTEDSDPMKSEMLLDTASISSPIHIDSLDPNTSFENALNFEMNDPDQLLGNPYVMYKLVLPAKSPNK